MKVKVITSVSYNLQDKINEWLEKNPNINIIRADISLKNSNTDSLTYIMLYEEIKLKL